jgi:uncharacterized ferredoxin-like protein
MIHKSSETERNATFRVAELMAVAARTAPKACGIDVIETLILDGDEKGSLTAAMRGMNLGKADNTYFVRDAGNVDSCHSIVLIGAAVNPRGLDCALCGVKDCATALKDGIACAMAVNDLGIAVGSAAATAMDSRIDNRVLFTAGMTALKLGLFPSKVKICFGIGLATTGKNVFFDRPAL